MPDVECRLAKIEEKHDAHKEAMKTHIQTEEERLDEITALLTEVRDKQTKMVGFWAGIAFAFSILGSCIVWLAQKAFLPGH